MARLIICETLPNLNDYTKANRTNRYAGAKMKKDCEEIITKYIQKQLHESFDNPVRLKFRWYEPNRRRDLDNIAFAKKFILDALVKNGIIKTDSWQGVIGFTDEFFLDSQIPRIEVDIEEVTNDAM